MSLIFGPIAFWLLISVVIVVSIVRASYWKQRARGAELRNEIHFKTYAGALVPEVIEALRGDLRKVIGDYEAAQARTTSRLEGMARSEFMHRWDLELRHRDSPAGRRALTKFIRNGGFDKDRFL